MREHLILVLGVSLSVPSVKSHSFGSDGAAPAALWAQKVDQAKKYTLLSTEIKVGSFSFILAC